MSGQGKGGKGLGKGGAKRHRKVLRDNIQGVTKPAIRRLARRGGVKRISGLIYEETRGVLKVFLESVLRDCVTYTEHARRKTVTALDVVYALKRQGKTLYGYGFAPQGGISSGGSSGGNKNKLKEKVNPGSFNKALKEYYKKSSHFKFEEAEGYRENDFLKKKLTINDKKDNFYVELSFFYPKKNYKRIRKGKYSLKKGMQHQPSFKAPYFRGRDKGGDKKQIISNNYNESEFYVGAVIEYILLYGEYCEKKRKVAFRPIIREIKKAISDVFREERNIQAEDIVNYVNIGLATDSYCKVTLDEKEKNGENRIVQQIRNNNDVLRFTAKELVNVYKKYGFVALREINSGVHTPVDMMVSYENFKKVKDDGRSTQFNIDQLIKRFPSTE